MPGTHVHRIEGYKLGIKGVIECKAPAFLKLNQCEKSGDFDHLMVSSFNLLGKDSFHIIENVKDLEATLASPAIKKISDTLSWPNEAMRVSSELFGYSGWLIASGFFLPHKYRGSITFIDEKTQRHVVITKKEGYFYHRVQVVHWGPNQSWALLTARAQVKAPFFHSKDTELVLLIPKKINGFESLDDIEFEERVLVKGPDVFFQVMDLDQDGIEEVFVAEYFSKRLTVYWWQKGELRSHVVDDTIGTAFDLAIADINQDGRAELVVTNHECEDHAAAVYAYEIPNNLVDNWTRHTLLKEVPIRQPGIHSAAPGSPQVFFPSKNHSGKPWIFISGDGSQCVHLLVPRSQDATDWVYTEHIVLDKNSTIGGLAIGDVDGDGFEEVFVPAYEESKVYVLGFSKELEENEGESPLN